MRFLDISLATTAEHLALEEALLLGAEQEKNLSELIHLWEPTQFAVIVGRGSRVKKEVNLSYCNQTKISVYRRCSGGAAIVGGPGCLMYGVVLDRRRHVELVQINTIHQYVLKKMADALSRLGTVVQIAGTSDLVIGSSTATDDNTHLFKFSGNSMRYRKHHVLYHGTILYALSSTLIADCLKSPPRQPDYRQERDHKSFVMNFPATAAALREAILRGWNVRDATNDFPQDAVLKLVREKYGNAEWNYRH